MGLSLIVFSIRILLRNSLHRLLRWRCIFFIRCRWFFFLWIDIKNRLIRFFYIIFFIFYILNIELSLFNLVSLLFIWWWTFFFFLFIRSFFLSFRLLVFVFFITLLFLFFWWWGLLYYINIFLFSSFGWLLLIVYFSFTWVWFRIIVLFIICIILLIVPVMWISILIVVIIVIWLLESLLLFILLPSILLRFASSLTLTQNDTKSDEKHVKKQYLPIQYLNTNCCISIITYFDSDNLLSNHLFPSSLLHLILIL